MPLCRWASVAVAAQPGGWGAGAVPCTWRHPFSRARRPAHARTGAAGSTRLLPASAPSSGAALPEAPSAPGRRPGPRNLALCPVGTWQADDNVISRRNTQRPRRSSSSSLEDAEHRPCVWGPLAV